MTKTLPTLSEALAKEQNPMVKAALFIAAVAYPEPGQGEKEQRGGPAFVKALITYHNWRMRKSHGLRALRDRLGDDFKLPHRATWEGTLFEGSLRVRRSMMALAAHEGRRMAGNRLAFAEMIRSGEFGPNGPRQAVSLWKYVQANIDDYDRGLRVRDPELSDRDFSEPHHINWLCRQIRACAPTLHLTFALRQAADGLLQHEHQQGGGPVTDALKSGLDPETARSWWAAFHVPAYWIDDAPFEAERFRDETAAILGLDPVMMANVLQKT